MGNTKSIMEQLSEPLSEYDIELRVGTAKSGSGFSLLSYKTARIDVDRLNKVCGLNWKNDFSFDKNDNLVASISVFDGEKWIERKDVGVESFTEKEKGLYSDALAA